MRLIASQAHVLRAVTAPGCHGTFFSSYFVQQCNLVTSMWKYFLALVPSLFSSPAHATYWDYDGRDTGQDSWVELSPDYAACGNGNNQSPVAINGAKTRDLPPLEFSYHTGSATLSLDRYTVVASPSPGLTMTEGDKISTLKEMLLRTPSEHEVADKFYPMELQLLHETADKKKIIVAIFINIGRENPAIQPIVDHYPASLTDRTTATIDWQALLPATRGYYAYQGSLPYPPCTEGVETRVLKTPIEISYPQAEKLLAKLGRNARNKQPLMLRTIFESKD